MGILRRFKGLGKISIFYFLCILNPIHSQDLGYISLTERLTCFEDVKREWEFLDYAHSAKMISNYTPEQNELSFPFNKSQYYCYIQVPTNAEAKNFLVIESSLHDYLDIILKDQYSNYKLMKGGDRVPNLVRSDKLFPRAVDLEEDNFSMVFFRFDSYDGYFPTTTIRLWNSQEFRKFQIFESALHRIVLGSLFTFFVISMIVYFYNWDSLYGFFSGYLFSIITILMIKNGVFYQMGIVNSFLQNEGLLISSCFALLFFVGVAFEFLNINLVISKSREIYFGIVAMILFLAVNFNDYSESFFLLFVITTLLGSGLLGFGIYRYFKGFQFDSLLFLVCFVPLVFSSVVALLKKFNSIQTSFLSDHSFVLSSLVHCAILAISIVKKLNLANVSYHVLEERKDSNELILNAIREQKDHLQTKERESVVNLLAAHLAHEVSNPLSNISIGESHLNQSINDLRDLVYESIHDSEEGEDLKKDIDHIFQDIDKGYQQIAIGEAKVSTGIQEIRGITGIDGMVVKEYDLFQVLHETIQFCFETNQIKEGRLHLKINQQSWPSTTDIQKIMINSNPHIMRRAIRTVLSNAIHFSQKGENRNIKIETGMIALGTRVMHTITILNDGPALLPGQESQLFDMQNYQLHGMEMIGLPMVKELLKNLGGNLILFDNGRKSGWVGFQIQISDYGLLKKSIQK
jgi:signal transduction histidine kinase